MELAVWAPTPEVVELVVDDDVLAMQRDDRGWWTTVASAAGAGARYGFRLDGAAVLPDPRSASQPGGVHGLSAIVDQSAFTWHDSAWRGRSLRGAVLYELHVGTFSPAGTFD